MVVLTGLYLTLNLFSVAYRKRTLTFCLLHRDCFFFWCHHNHQSCSAVVWTELGRCDVVLE